MRLTRPTLPICTLAVASLVLATDTSAQQCVLQSDRVQAPEDVRRVPTHWIRDALRLDEDRVTRLGWREPGAPGYGPRADLPYDPRTTSNLGRLQAEVYFQIARRSDAHEDRGQLFVRSPDWFWSYLAAAGVDSASAPPSARNSLAHGQGIQLDARTERVVKRVKKGPEPRFAMNVRTWWPEQDGPSRYTYQDSLSTPPLQVTSKRVITYRLLDFGDMIVYDKIEGSSGRPLEGFLSFLFNTFGEANLKQSRMALSEDGLLVVRGTGKWIINKSRTFVVHPDGSVGDIPDDRPDLEAIKTRLEQDLDIEYHDYAWGCETRTPPLPASVADDETDDQPAVSSRSQAPNARSK